MPPPARTLVISDLHLGMRNGADVLRRSVPRGRLLEALDGVDRLVLLGDALELRQGPLRDALAAARPVFEAIGDALGAGAEVVLVPGNHDHRLLDQWFERRGAVGPTAPLGLEEHPGPDASPALEAIAGWLAPARLDVAYPGVWLRDDVYAIHGHYLDRHITVPTIERLGAGAMARVVGPVPERARPDDYERALAPLYAWITAIAERTPPGDGGTRTSVSAAAWKLLAADGHRPLRGRLLAGVLPLGAATINRLGLGPVNPDLSAAELRRAGVLAMGEACERLGIVAEHVLFGHTHRAGPFAADDELEWTIAGHGRLANSGCWVYEEAFLRTGRSSPYWPGGAMEVRPEGPPVPHRLLEDVDAGALRPSRA
jgi:Calcineurin-like phosphoesterase